MLCDGHTEQSQPCWIHLMAPQELFLCNEYRRTELSWPVNYSIKVFLISWPSFCSVYTLIYKPTKGLVKSRRASFFDILPAVVSQRQE